MSATIGFRSSSAPGGCYCNPLFFCAGRGWPGVGEDRILWSYQVSKKEQIVSLAASLSEKAKFTGFSVWLIGETPLITHAWSEKARREMLSKQVKAVKSGREARDPQADFVSSLYEMGDGKYGFPVTGFKNCILSAAHKDKGIPRTVVQSALFLDAEMVRVRPALAGAICDMPLVRIHGGNPEMREDMVKIGKGLNKVASLAYRGQFTNWAVRITGRFNSSVLSAEQIGFLIDESGIGYGVGEWRNEKKGIFGAFRRGPAEEERAWSDFAAGRGPLPVRQYAEAA
jgi:hypothetical protein